MQPRLGHPDIFSSEGSFAPPVGSQLGSDGRLRGYYVDFSLKADEPSWPPSWLDARDAQFHVATIQWALGAWERYLMGEGEAWRAAALEAAGYLISEQETAGVRTGAWLHWFPMPHTYRIDAPWVSSIAQGEAASLLARLFVETGEERFAEAAHRALAPMQVPIGHGGVRAEVDGLPFFEEYPTQPASLVLNGGIFALWGFHDVAAALDDSSMERWFDDGVEALVGLLPRYDTGHWSRYDLFPHPVSNVASGAYHLLHINQLAVLSSLTGRSELDQVRERFESYRLSPRKRRRALVHKVAFRLVNPRNDALAHRLPWNNRARGSADLIVLCYHAVSERWEASLAVTPKQLEEQLQAMIRAGYTPSTFTEAVYADHRTKIFAVTFDDSYQSVDRLARPVMDRLGIPGTVFVPTAHVGDEPMAWPGIDGWKGTQDEHELRPLSWEQLRSLARNGWEIGSHTRTHPRLTEVSATELDDQLRASREDCERALGQPCTSVAYPYGDENRAVARAAARAGYAAGASLPPPYNERTVMSWPRTGVHRADGRLRFRTKRSRHARRLRRSPLGGLLASVFQRSSSGPMHRARGS